MVKCKQGTTCCTVDLFDVGVPDLSGFMDAPVATVSSGAGSNVTLAPGGVGTFSWLIAPTTAAALTAPQVFSVGGSLSCARSRVKPRYLDGVCLT